jgi:hypothetical protein
MSEDLEKVFEAFYANRVPLMWREDQQRSEGDSTTSAGSDAQHTKNDQY